MGEAPAVGDDKDYDDDSDDNDDNDDYDDDDDVTQASGGIDSDLPKSA